MRYWATKVNRTTTNHYWVYIPVHSASLRYLTQMPLASHYRRSYQRRRVNLLGSGLFVRLCLYKTWSQCFIVIRFTLGSLFSVRVLLRIYRWRLGWIGCYFIKIMCFIWASLFAFSRRFCCFCSGRRILRKEELPRQGNTWRTQLPLKLIQTFLIIDLWKFVRGSQL